MGKEQRDPDALIATLAESARDESERLGAHEHLELDLLIAYQSGILAVEIERQVRYHLVGCQACARQLLDLDALLSEAVEPTGDGDAARLAASWGDFNARLAEKAAISPEAKPAQREGEDHKIVVPIRDGRTLGRGWISRPLLAAAAGLLVIIGLTLVSFARPEIHHVDEVVRGEPPQRLEIGRFTLFVELRIQPGFVDPESFASFAVELVSDGDVLWRADDIEPGRHGWLEVKRSRWSFPEGDLRLLVHGLKPDGQEVGDRVGRGLSVHHR